MTVRNLARLHQWCQRHERLVSAYVALTSVLMVVPALCAVLIITGKFTSGLEVCAFLVGIGAILAYFGLSVSKAGAR